MRAFAAYWILLGVALTVLVAAAVTSRGAGGLNAALREPFWFVALLAPLALAAIDLILFRRTHEEVCALEIRRHPWLRFIAGNGYSARTFGLTGVAMLVGIVALAFLTVSR